MRYELTKAVEELKFKYKQEIKSLLENYLREKRHLVFENNNCIQEIGTQNLFLILDWDLTNDYPLNGQTPQISYIGYDVAPNGTVDTKLRRLDGAIAKLRYQKAEGVELNRGYTYLVKMDKTDYYKIGITTNIKSRIDTLRNASPLDIVLVASKKAIEPRDLERSLHQLFAANRRRGEWFEFTEDEVKNILATYFDEQSQERLT